MVRVGKRILTGPLPVFLAVAGALLGMSVSACGGARHVAGAATGGSSAGDATSEPATTATTTSVIPPGQFVRGDGDADNPSDIDGNGDSDSARVGGPDNDADNPTPQSYRFPDSDDKPTFAFGHRPSVVDGRAIASVVRRYYAAASRSDGATACALLQPSLARSVPESFSGPLGPSYMRGAKTCQAVLSRFFQHYHGQLAAATEVVEVRVKGGSAKAIFSSRTMRASSVFLMRRGSSWWLVEVLGQPLP